MPVFTAPYRGELEIYMRKNFAIVLEEIVNCTNYPTETLDVPEDPALEPRSENPRSLR